MSSNDVKIIDRSKLFNKKRFGNKKKARLRYKEDHLTIRQNEIYQELIKIYPSITKDAWRSQYWFDFELRKEKILISIVFPNSRPGRVVLSKLENQGYRVMYIDYSDKDGSSLKNLIEAINSAPPPKNKHIIREEKKVEASAISVAIEKLEKSGKLPF